MSPTVLSNLKQPCPPGPGACVGDIERPLGVDLVPGQESRGKSTRGKVMVFQNPPGSPRALALGRLVAHMGPASLPRQEEDTHLCLSRKLAASMPRDWETAPQSPVLRVGFCPFLMEVPDSVHRCRTRDSNPVPNPSF